MEKCKFKDGWYCKIKSIDTECGSCSISCIGEENCKHKQVDENKSC